MAATAIERATRYYDVGTTRVYWVPTVAATNLVPTRAELDAGTDLSDDVAELEGWSLEGGEIETPDLGSLFTSKIPGRLEAADSSLTMYASDDGQDIRTILELGDAGYICWMDGGDVPANLMEVYPVRVRSVSLQRSTGDDPARVLVQFSITRQPATGVAIPATV